MSAPKRPPEWPQLAEKTSVAGIRILLFIRRLLGERCFRAALLPVLACYWCSNARLRRVVGAYQARARRAGAALPARFAGIRELERFALAILEKFSALSGAAGHDGPAALVVVGDEVFAGDGPSEGAVILTSHTGCQELLMAHSGAFTAHELVILQHTAHARRFNELLARAGAKPVNASFIEIGAAVSPALVMELADRTARGAYVILAGDRAPMGSEASARVPFFGDPARFPTGGALLAHLLGVPLRMMVCTRPDEAVRRYRVRFTELCASPPRVRRAERTLWLREMAALYARELERELTASPLDWANFFDFWEEFRK